MCGRVVQAEDPVAIALFLNAAATKSALTVKPHYNIAPSASILVATIQPDKTRRLDVMHWGLIPAWAKETSTHYATFNARAETLREKRTFSAAFKKRRCLIPVSGFYEWKKEHSDKNSEKIPFYFTRLNNAPLVFAGLYEEGHSEEGEVIPSCTIVTTQASSWMNTYHTRMPVVLESQDIAEWIALDSTDDRLNSLLQSPTRQVLKTHEIDKKIGNVRNNSVEFLEPINSL